MNFLHWIFVGLVVYNYAITFISTAPTATDHKIKAALTTNPEKRDTSKQQTSTDDVMSDDIFADETKKKRSQEVIMFGNQQNKPAGMVDDGLVRFAEKKAQKRENNGADQVDDQNDNSDQDDQVPSKNREILPQSFQKTSGASDKVPVISEMGSTDNQDYAENGQFQSGNSEFDDTQDVYLPRGYLSESQLDELDDPSQSLEADPSYLSRDWNEYNAGNRFYGNDDDIYRRRRRRRNAAATASIVKADRSGFRHRNMMRKRSNLLTPLDQLMNSRRGAGSGRLKRDLKLSKDDVVGLLGILAAAEAAKERQQNRQHGLTELESAYLDSLSETRPAEAADDGDGLNRYFDPLSRYDNPIDDEPNNDVEIRNVPDWTFLEAEPNLELRRRSKPFYPPVDYRSLGVIGVKKRSTSHYYPGMWGRFEAERKRGIFRKGPSDNVLPEVGSFRGRFQDSIGYEDDRRMSDDDDIGGGDGIDDDENDQRVDEELYTLGELLNGNDVDDIDQSSDRYPVYKRLI